MKYLGNSEGSQKNVDNHTEVSQGISTHDLQPNSIHFFRADAAAIQPEKREQTSPKLEVASVTFSHHRVWGEPHCHNCIGAGKLVRIGQPVMAWECQQSLHITPACSNLNPLSDTF